MKANKILARSTVAAVALAAFAVPAMAADVVYQEPPAPAAPLEVAPVATWAGPYAGLSFGYGFSGSTEGPGTDIDTDGWLGGVFGGYNFQNGMLVYGAEADFNISDVNGEDGGVSSRSRMDGSLRGRLGAAVTDNVLIYGTAGAAAERQRISVAGDRDTQAMLGYTVGAGVDALLTDNVFGRVEYRYTDYGSQDFELGGGSADFDSNNHRVTMGVGLKF